MSRKPISDSTLKRLFSLTGNKCAFPGCDINIVDRFDNFIGQVCHIEAAEEGGQRYNRNQDDDQRRDFKNLMILCPNHHKITDNVQKYDTATLKKMKQEHERKHINHEKVISSETMAQAKNLTNKKVNNVISNGHQIITKKGDIVINYNQNQTQESNSIFSFLKNILTLNLDANRQNKLKPKESDKFSFYNIPDSLKKLSIYGKINIDDNGSETKKLLKKASRKNASEKDKTTTEILKARVKSPLDPKSKFTLKRIISNLEKSNIRDKENILRVSKTNSNNLSNILNKLSLAKADLEIEEMEKIKIQGLETIERQKAEILFSSGKAYLDLLMFKNAKTDLLAAHNLDPDNPVFVNEIFKLAVSTEDYELSLDLSLKTHKFLEKSYSIDILGDLYTNLGMFYYSKGDYNKAYAIYSELKKYLSFSSSVSNNQIHEITINLATILLANGQIDQAYDLIISNLEKTITNFKINEPVEIYNDKIARLYNCISLIYATKNDFAKALKYSNIFNRIISNLSLNTHTNPYLVTLSHLNYGIIQFYKGNLKEAEKQSFLAKDYIQDNIGADFSLMANTYANFGGIHLLEGNTKAALREYSKAEEILSSHHNRSNLLKMASIYCHQGNVYKMNEDFSKSKDLYENALGILSSLFEPNSPNIVNINYNLINPSNSQNIILAF